MSEAYSGVGTLSDEKTVILDQPIRLPPGRVRVIVEPLPDEQPENAWLDTLRAIRQTLRESGYRYQSRTEIDEQIRSEREGWED
jgi:hypothetical protein